MRQLSSNNNVEMLKISPDLNVTFVTDPQGLEAASRDNPHSAQLNTSPFCQKSKNVFMMTRSDPKLNVT